MALSRRQFFRRLWKPGDDPTPQRLARYQDLETYTRTQLLPYDFPLTPDQERELIAAVRDVLDKASNDELFSNLIRARIEEVVDAKTQPWRLEDNAGVRAQQLREMRNAAPDYVHAFLTLNAGEPIVDQLMHNYGTADISELETILKDQIRTCIEETNDRLLQQYDIISVQDLVFAQLRSWC